MNKKAPSLFSSVILFLLSLNLIPVASAAPKNFLWKVIDKDSTMYLMGSVHVARQDLYPLSPVIEDAFKSADSLVVEVDLNSVDPVKLQTLITESAFYPEGESLKKNVAPELYETVVAELSELGTSADRIQNLRPWFLASLLINLKLEKFDYKPAFGLEKHFLDKAKESNKKVIELEDFASQLQLLSGLSKEEQELFLSYTVEDVNQTEEFLDTLFASWKSGKIKEMEEILFAPFENDPALAPISKKLFEDRNLKMLSRLEELLRGSGTVFVLVGSGHLLGEKGLLRLLEEKGFPIEQL